MNIVSMDLVVLAGQGNLTIPPFAKYTPQPATLLLDTHHNLIRLVVSQENRWNISKIFLKYFLTGLDQERAACRFSWISSRFDMATAMVFMKA